MPEEAVVAIAPVPLARSAWYSLLLPLILLLVGVAAAVAGLLLPGGWAQLGVAGVGALVAILGVYLAAVLATVRMEVEVSTLRLRWMGVDRRYQLVRGAVTRVPLSGERAARLDARFGLLGWGLGPARLRGEERVLLVRLARSPAVILIPTDSGRVAVAPRSEQQLIDALTAAARVQQRLEQIAAQARPTMDRPVEEALVAPPAPRLVEPAAGRVLTGIERVLLEERLAAQRAAALAAAEAERLAAEEAARAAEEAAAAAAAAATRAPESARDRTVPRMGRPRVAFPSLPRPRLQGVPADRLAGYGMAALPLLAGAALWGVATLTGRLELPDAELQATSVALVLVGPLAALGALAARAWFPRLLGLVTLASLAALLLIGRALIA